jgi:hypothetical protein
VKNAEWREPPDAWGCVSLRGLPPRHKLRVSTARIVVPPWRSPVRSIGRALTESRRDVVVAVLAEVPPMGVGLRRGRKRANRDCRACDCCAYEKTKGSMHHRLPRLSSACFQRRVNGSLQTGFRSAQLQIVNVLTEVLPARRGLATLYGADRSQPFRGDIGETIVDRPSSCNGRASSFPNVDCNQGPSLRRRRWTSICLHILGACRSGFLPRYFPLSSRSAPPNHRLQLIR